MRKRRHDRWVGGAALLTTLVVFGLATTTPVRAEATPTPTNEPAATPTAAPTSTPTIGCQNPWATAYPDDHIVRGETIRVAFHDLDAEAAVTLLYVAEDADMTTTPIGSGRSDGRGEGVVAGAIPTSAPIGEAELQVVSDHCLAYTYALVIGSEERMTVDDPTPLPGQVVTVHGGGFGPNSPVGFSIDRYPIQGECYPDPCRFLGGGSADALGVVVKEIRIPSDVRAGTHHLYGTGYSPDGISDYTIGVRIRVAGASETLPPTETAG